MKTAIRTPIVEAIRSVIQGGGGGPVSPVPLFYWKGQNTLAATTGTDPTFTRATAATFEDFEGLIKTVESQEPRFQGARRVENLLVASEDFTNSAWLLQSGAAKVGTSVVDGVTAMEVSFGATAASIYASSGIPTTAVRTATFWVRAVSGATAIRIGTGEGFSPDIAIDDTKWWPVTRTASAASVDVQTYLRSNAAGTTTNVYIYKAQVEDVTGQTNQNPSEYVSTGVGTGPELVTNGTFDGNLDGWTSGNSGAQDVTYDNGRVKVAQKASPTWNGGAEQTIAVDVGSTYTVSVDIEVGQGGGRVVTSPNMGYPSGIIVKDAGPTGTYTTTFVAVSSPIAFKLVSPAAAGNYVFFDNFSVKSVSHGANIDGVQYFNTLNANTVTANVVTEAVGSPLTRANTQFGDLHGVGGDYFSTPNVVTTWPELDIRVRATRDSQGTNMLFGKDGAGQRAFQLYYAASGAFLFYYSEDGSTVLSTTLTSAVPFAVGELGWWRVTLDAATGDIKFFTADGNLEAPAISDYTQQGATQNPAGGATSIAVTTASFLVAAWALNTGTYPYDGRFYRAQVYNEIDGTTPVVDFTPGSYVSGSTFVSSTSGETWTLEGNASIFQPPVDESGPFGYLAEKPSTNLVLYSEDFTAGNWLQSVTVQADQATAPDGTLTADKVTGAGSGRLYQAINVLASRDYTFSLWVNSVDMTTFPIQAMNSSGLTNILTVDVISSLTVGAFSRVEFSFNTGTATNVRIYVGSTGSLAGWPSGQQAYLWGAQLEKSTYPTSYIPTTTTAVTRNADVLIAGDMVTDAAGSGYAEASSTWATAGGNHFPLSTDGNGRILYVYSGTSSTLIRAYDGANVATSPTGTSYQNRPAPMASTWGNNLTAYKDGVGGTAASYDGTMGTGNLGIGASNTGSDQWNGTIREVKIFDTELTAEEIGDL